jgi:hypothetical protein
MQATYLHLESILLWGFVATLVLTTILSASQGLRQTRMSVPMMLGTLVSSNLDRVKIYGFVLHFLNGWLFSVLYGLVFEALGRTAWWIGAALGLVHSLFLLAVLLPVLPSVHPRMAGEYQQPKPTALLEPPGFMGLHYGARTPFTTLAAHLVYGAILGAFYELA